MLYHLQTARHRLNQQDLTALVIFFFYYRILFQRSLQHTKIHSLPKLPTSKPSVRTDNSFLTPSCNVQFPNSSSFNHTMRLMLPSGASTQALPRVNKTHRYFRFSLPKPFKMKAPNLSASFFQHYLVFCEITRATKRCPQASQLWFLALDQEYHWDDVQPKNSINSKLSAFFCPYYIFSNLLFSHLFYILHVYKNVTKSFHSTCSTRLFLVAFLSTFSS